MSETAGDLQFATEPSPRPTPGVPGEGEEGEAWPPTTGGRRCAMSLFFKTVRIKPHERGLWFRHGEFRRLLAPGAYKVAPWNRGRDKIEVVSTLDTLFGHKQLD